MKENSSQQWSYLDTGTGKIILCTSLKQSGNRYSFIAQGQIEYHNYEEQEKALKYAHELIMARNTAVASDPAVMNKIQIAHALFKNTTNIYLENLLENYIANMDLGTAEDDFDIHDEWMGIDKCVSYLQSVSFDMSDWELYEIPIHFTYCFLNAKTEQNFDLVLSDDGQVNPSYVDSNSNQQIAPSIQEAIEKYYIPE